MKRNVDRRKKTRSAAVNFVSVTNSMGQSPTASIQEASVPAAWRTIAQSRRFGSAALRATSVVVNVKSATAVGRGKPCGKGFEESRFEGLD
jgi:hypothetical protein